MVAVKIKASANVTSSAGSVRLAPDPRRTNVNKGPVWSYKLDPGNYAFNVDFFVIGGATASFEFTNATAITETSFTPDGPAGAVIGDNQDILFIV